MADIFFSYGPDDRAKVDAIVKRLRDVGYSVRSEAATRVGDEYARTIEKEMRDSACIIVALSDFALKSEWVERAISYGHSHAKLLTVLIAKVKSLPPGMRVDLDMADWSDRINHGDISELKRHLLSRIGLRQKERVVTVTATPSPSPNASIPVALWKLTTHDRAIRAIARRILWERLKGNPISGDAFEEWQYGDQQELAGMWKNRPSISNELGYREKYLKKVQDATSGKCNVCKQFTLVGKAHRESADDEGYWHCELYCPRCVKLNTDYGIFRKDLPSWQPRSYRYGKLLGPEGRQISWKM